MNSYDFPAQSNPHLARVHPSPKVENTVKVNESTVKLNAYSTEEVNFRKIWIGLRRARPSLGAMPAAGARAMAVLALLGAILVSTIHGGCSTSDSVCGSASAGALPAMARPEGARALPLRLRGGAMYDEMVLEDDPERFDQSDPMNASPLPHAARSLAQSAREAGHRPLASSPTLTLRTPKHDHVSYYGILFDVRAKCVPFPNRSTQASTIAR